MQIPMNDAVASTADDHPANSEPTVATAAASSLDRLTSLPSTDIAAQEQSPQKLTIAAQTATQGGSNPFDDLAAVCNETASDDETPLGVQHTSRAPPQSAADAARTGERSANEYQLKSVEWWDVAIGQHRRLRVITQNENGPCPLLAICNVLLLRGDIEILPVDRPVVTTAYLLELLGDRLLRMLSDAPRTASTCQASSRKSLEQHEGAVNVALRMLPGLQHGLDVDPKFSSPRGFVQNDGLSVFQAFGIELVHGWCVDPQDEGAWEVLCRRYQGYNSVAELVARGDYAGKGLVVDQPGYKHASDPASQAPRDDDAIDMDGTQRMDLVHDALIAQQFLEANATQLTFHGLQTLTESIPDNHLCILFRNNHFATLYKHPDQTLYLLVTDASLAGQSSAAWENLSDVYGSTSEMVDSNFCPQRAIDDYARHESDPSASGIDADFALALSLQQEEEEQHRRAVAEQRRQAYLQATQGSGTAPGERIQPTRPSPHRAGRHPDEHDDDSMHHANEDGSGQQRHKNPKKRESKECIIS
ncbi:hypothetical protein THASP1DRAFT_28187 [Thamnocephalis sphaerospora]|uniref:MINDY deubiquitinase domain-containing protein n=1 Tax=Thamnocephalis sphaerospora TaxID=78915 RepID=A0A4P9XUW0_9FUNG|nr:hypothetical protein THASP1DRAFT_28187 [Thamnocephalis sphaerospora]|eukprot:RKP10037.1 hypothetical protein THASP1DRAFT_28187 [Thamnocephalis sphaerospora]